MLINYIKMKKNEIKIKSVLYKIIVEFMDNQKDMFTLLQKVYNELKDVPEDELRKEIIDRIAILVHNESEKTTEAKNGTE